MQSILTLSFSNKWTQINPRASKKGRRRKIPAQLVDTAGEAERDGLRKGHRRMQPAPQSLSQARLSVTPWTAAARLPCPWGVSGKNTGVGCRLLLQGLFPTPGPNLRLLHWQACVIGQLGGTCCQHREPSSGLGDGWGGRVGLTGLKQGIQTAMTDSRRRAAEAATVLWSRPLQSGRWDPAHSSPPIREVGSSLQFSSN